MLKSGLFLSTAACILTGWLVPPASAQQLGDPIAYVGHGGFFDHSGTQIPVTQSFVADALQRYRERFLDTLDDARRREFQEIESRMLQELPTEDRQSELAVQQLSLERLFALTPEADTDFRTLGVLHALRYALTFELPTEPLTTPPERREPFELAPEILDRLRDIDLEFGEGGALKATTNIGQAYLNECMQWKVPIPPPINQMDPAGVNGWKSEGFIPQADQFILGTPAELRSYRSSSPAGMCYALPRYTDATMTTVMADGVICLSQETSKTCFWDNRMTATGVFQFPAGDIIPIGVADLNIDPQGRYQGGGYELRNGDVCTDCHAGENPYITHPRSNLGTATWESVIASLPTFAPFRYDPLVAMQWPQNQLSQAVPTLPQACQSCHTKGGSGGRLGHLSNELPGYCGLLRQAHLRTMPPAAPGSAAAAAEAFRTTYCNAPPNASSADAGDPHFTTVSGVHYDFQGAGEFVVLKDSDTGFEVQVRQSPIPTTFTPPANPYTGLASCASLNTAVAARIGKNRVTFQPDEAGERMEIRIDGGLVAPDEPSIVLGLGASVTATPDGGLEAKSADGTQLKVTPLFWPAVGVWYLDINVTDTPAREGVMGTVLPDDWLPAAPDGSSFGPIPADLLDRHAVLNGKFADAWRVTSATSLFDYTIGTDTKTFTDPNWPPEPSQSCAKSPISDWPPRERMEPELAQAACRRIEDPGLRENCLFDVAVMGFRGAAENYIRNDKVLTQVK